MNLLHLSVFNGKLNVFVWLPPYSVDPEQSYSLLSGLYLEECNLQKLGHISLVGFNWNLVEEE